MPRKVFTAGEILTAANLNDVSDQSVMVFDDDTARTTAIPTPVEGMVTYLSDEDEVQVFDGSAFKAVGPGKILQVVRATDSTDRVTTSTVFVDVTGMSVTITPKESDSALIIVAAYQLSGQITTFSNVQITDSSNNPISGAESSSFNAINTVATQFGYVTPATTSAVTFKLRHRRSGGTSTTIANSIATGQMYAIEVSA